MFNAMPTWSKEEENFAEKFKEIEESFKLTNNANIALKNLSVLSEKIHRYLIRHPNSRPSNTLKILICSMRSRIFDDLENIQEARSNLEEMRRRLMQPHLISADKAVRLFKEYSEFLAFYGEYQKALKIGYEAFLPNFDGNTPAESSQTILLRYHLGRLHQVASNDLRLVIREYKQVFNFYIQHSHQLDENVFLEVAQNLAELYLNQQKLADFLCLYVSQGDFFFEKKAYKKSVASYEEGLNYANHFFKLYPNRKTSHFYSLIKDLKTKLASVYSEQGDYAKAYELRKSCSENEEGFFSSCNNFFQRIIPQDIVQAQQNLFVDFNNLNLARRR